MKYLQAVVLIVGLSSQTVYAQFQFDFVAVETDQVLAALQVDRLSNIVLPNIVDFNFTPAGREMFGYPNGYMGEFDEMRDGRGAYWFYDEFDMRLSGRGDGGSNNQASLFDFDAPIPSFPSSATSATIQLIAGDAGGIIRLRHGSTLIQPQGEWRLVPEPSAGAFSVLLCALPFLKRQRRRS